MMKRREFITLIGGVTAAWSLAARAQQTDSVRRIGALMARAATDPESKAQVGALEQRLHELGWTPSHNVVIEYRWPEGDVTRMQTYAAELVALQPDVILAASTSAVAAFQKKTRTLPVIFWQVTDPVSAGFVASLARPAGNLTGITNFEFSMGGKWLELLKDVAPNLARVAVIYGSRTAPFAPSMIASIKSAAPVYGMGVVERSVHDAGDIERAIQQVASERHTGLLVLADITTVVHRQLIVTTAGRYGLAAIYPFRSFVTSGGLLSYGINPTDAIRQAAEYLDRVLRGAKPEELPVQAPNKFDLAINLQTAKALGLDVPSSLLALADEVIE
jgi:putative ABC transport system substrate-binding protein